MLVSSLAELRSAMQSATAGDKIELAPGEYQGAFIIDKPITLRGKDRLTVLWRHGAPVIWVRTPGVKLDKLLLERTVHSGPLVVHDANCAPTGRESILLETLINLGELIPGATVTLPLEIETSGTADVVVSGFYGALVTPTTIQTAGTHVVWLTLEGSAMVRGEVLLGELAVREGSTTRNIWLLGTVVDAAPISGHFCIGTKKNKIHPSPRGLLLDSTFIGALEGISVEAGRYAHIQYDPNGLLFLYVPSEPPAPVLVNNHAVPKFSRLLLHEKDTIKIGGAAFTVQPAEPAPVRIEPSILTFPDFDEQFPEAATITVHNGKAAWKGRLISAAPWASVTPENDFRLPASRSSEWMVQPNAEALTLPDGIHEVIGGLLAVGSNHVVCADVKIGVNRPDIVLQIQSVDAGTVEWGSSTEQVLDVSIGNLGRGTWTGTTRSTVSWLEVVTPMPMTCEAWAEAVVQVQVVPNWDTLAVGTYDLPSALVIETPDGDQPIPVKLEIIAAKPRLAATPSYIHFEHVERNAPLPKETLELLNEGGSVWMGTVKAINGWVRVLPAEFTQENPISSGEAVEVEVSLLDVPAELALDTPIIVDEIHIEGENTDIVVSVQMTVVELPPYLVANPVMFAPFVKGDSLPEGSLRIHNNGPARWRGQVVSNNPILNVPDNTFICEPGDSIELAITLNSKLLDSLPGGLTHLENALSITGGREPVSASASIDVREPISELHLDTPTLNFGQVNGAVPELPTQTLRIVNAVPSVNNATIEVCVPYLAIQGSGEPTLQIEVPGNTIVEFTVILLEAVRYLLPGVIADDRTIVIRSGEKEMAVCSLVMLNEWAALLTVSPDNVKLIGDTPQAVSIHNTGQQTWTVQLNTAEWITAEPSTLTLAPDQTDKVELRRSDKATVAIDDPRGVVIIAPGREFDVAVSIEGKAEVLEAPQVNSPVATPQSVENNGTNSTISTTPSPIPENAIVPDSAQSPESPISQTPIESAKPESAPEADQPKATESQS